MLCNGTAASSATPIEERSTRHLIGGLGRRQVKFKNDALWRAVAELQQEIPDAPLRIGQGELRSSIPRDLILYGGISDIRIGCS